MTLTWKTTLATPLLLTLPLLLGCPPKSDGETSADDTGDTSDTSDTNESDTGETEDTDTGETEETDTGTKETDTGDPPPPLSYATDIEPLFTGTCTTNCHSGSNPSAGMDLTNGYAEMVGVNSSQARSLKIVNPGDSSTSYLVNKLEGTQSSAGGSGNAMPPQGTGLSGSEEQLVKDWIDAGAAP